MLLVGSIIAAMALYNLYRLLRHERGCAGIRPPRVGGGGGFAYWGGSGVLVGRRGCPGFDCADESHQPDSGPDCGHGHVFWPHASTIGGAWRLSSGDYNAILVRGLILGGVAGVLLGAWLSSKLPAKPLRAALSVALFGLGLQLCWKACF